MKRSWPHDRILTFPRAAIQYPHSVYGSLELSYSRLQRDSKWSTMNGFDEVCLALLWLLSKTHTKMFSRQEVEQLCRRAWSNEPDLRIQSSEDLRKTASLDWNMDTDASQVASKHSSPPFIVHLRALTKGNELIYDCIAQLQQAGFLTEDRDGYLRLNSLTMSWVLETRSRLLFGTEDPDGYIGLMKNYSNGTAKAPQSPSHTNGRVLESSIEHA